LLVADPLTLSFFDYYPFAAPMLIIDLGPEDPNVAHGLENYAMLLRKTYREAEAAKLEARAKAIWASHEQKNPAK